MYRRVHLSGSSWSLDGVRVLVTPLERLRGIRGANGSPVLLLAGSVHTFTLSHPISVAVIDIDGVVVRAMVMQPGRILNLRTRHWILEAPPDESLPRPGTLITASTMPGDGRNTRRLRDTHRKPQGSI